MTHTVTEKVRGTMGNARFLIADVAVSSYTAGGEVLTLAELGFSSVDYIGGNFTARSANKLDVIQATYKLVATVCSTGAEVAAETNIGTVRILVIGDAAW